MNANELADALQETEPYYSTDYKVFDKAATMLRQQFDQIADLKTTIKFLEEECKALRNQVTKGTEVHAK
jgi:hypothetical protein